MAAMKVATPMLALLAAACSGPGGADPLFPDGTPPECASGQSPLPGSQPGELYPEGAVEPMALGEVLTPYAWPEAVSRATGARSRLDLHDVPCATDPDIDWSPFDVLLFVSIPAW